MIRLSEMSSSTSLSLLLLDLSDEVGLGWAGTGVEVVDAVDAIAIDNFRGNDVFFQRRTFFLSSCQRAHVKMSSPKKIKLLSSMSDPVTPPIEQVEDTAEKPKKKKRRKQGWYAQAMTNLKAPSKTEEEAKEDHTQKMKKEMPKIEFQKMERI